MKFVKIGDKIVNRDFVKYIRYDHDTLSMRVGIKGNSVDLHINVKYSDMNTILEDLNAFDDKEKDKDK